jgi:hypothetical protein
VLYNASIGIGNEEGAGGIGEARDLHDPFVDHVDRLSPKDQQEEWSRISHSLLDLTRKEVSGEINPIELEEIDDMRGIASALFRKMGKTNIIQAATLGLIDCVPDEEWEKMTRMHIGDEVTKKTIDHFNKKRKSKNIDPQETD